MAFEEALENRVVDVLLALDNLTDALERFDRVVSALGHELRKRIIVKETK